MYKWGVFMRLQESGEMYIESIYVLNKKMGNVRSIDVCEYLGYSKPSVSRAMSLLKKGGFVIMESHPYRCGTRGCRKNVPASHRVVRVINATWRQRRNGSRRCL